jgi:hypothetical protein
MLLDSHQMQRLLTIETDLQILPVRKPDSANASDLHGWQEKIVRQTTAAVFGLPRSPRRSSHPRLVANTPAGAARSTSPGLSPGPRQASR